MPGLNWPGEDCNVSGEHSPAAEDRRITRNTPASAPATAEPDTPTAARQPPAKPSSPRYPAPTPPARKPKLQSSLPPLSNLLDHYTPDRQNRRPHNRPRRHDHPRHDPPQPVSKHHPPSPKIKARRPTPDGPHRVDFCATCDEDVTPLGHPTCRYATPRLPISQAESAEADFVRVSRDFNPRFPPATTPVSALQETPLSTDTVLPSLS